MDNQTLHRPNFGILPAIGIILLLLAAVFLADASPAWMILSLLGLSFIAALFWWGNPGELLFLGFVATLAIDISKALVVEGGVYTPGLSLFLSDLFFLGFLGYRIIDRFLITRERMVFPRPLKIALAFTLYMWISGATSNNQLAGLLAAISHTKYFLTALLIVDYIDSPRRLRLALAALTVGLSLQLLMMAAQFISGSDLAIQGSKNTTLGTTLVFESAGGFSAFRPTGFLNHPNVVADYLVFVIPILLGLGFAGKRRIGGVWHIALILLLGSLIGLILTLSRAGWIAAFLGVVFLIAVGLKKGLCSRRHVAGFIGLLIAVAIAVAVVYPGAYLRLTESDQRSSESRWIMMDQAMLIISRNPVFGVGLGGYNGAAQENKPESFTRVSTYFQKDLLKGVVHNKYLLVAAEHGIVGLLLFLAIFFAVLNYFLRFPYWIGPVYLALGAGLASGIASQLVFFLFDTFYTDLRIQLLWLFIGMLLAVCRIQEMVARGSALRQ
jgi:O-antigen ligase